MATIGNRYQQISNLHLPAAALVALALAAGQARADKDCQAGGDKPEVLADSGAALCLARVAIPTTKHDLLRLRGKVILPDGEVLTGGEVVIKNFGKGKLDGEIVCAACNCKAVADYAKAFVIECPHGVISPGLINLHDHISFNGPAPQPHATRYMHRQEWRRGVTVDAEGKGKLDGPLLPDPARPEVPTGAQFKDKKPPVPDATYGDKNYAEIMGALKADVIAYGEIRHLIAGTTADQSETIANAEHGKNLLLNLDGYAPAGDAKKVIFATFPLGDARAGERITAPLRDDSTCAATYKNIPPTLEAQATGSAAYIAHLAEGIDHAAHNEVICAHKALISKMAASEHVAFVHAIGLTHTDTAQFATQHVKMVWSPRSNADLYSYTAPIAMLDKAGVKIALATDWLASGSMNLLRELQCAAHLNVDNFGTVFTDKRLWEMVTADAALVSGTGAKLGRLEAGHVADVAVFDGNGKPNAYRAIIDGTPAAVGLVIRAGDPLYGDEAVMTAVASAPAHDGSDCEELDVCTHKKSLCLHRMWKRTSKQLVDAIKSHSKLVESIAKDMAGGAVPYSPARNPLSTLYPLFACGVPEHEPSCQLNRPIENHSAEKIGILFGYTGKPAAGAQQDSDGDGIPDAVDKCPHVFDARRPMDPVPTVTSGKFSEMPEGEACK